jgi:hypothetical protein
MTQRSLAAVTISQSLGRIGLIDLCSPSDDSPGRNAGAYERKTYCQLNLKETLQAYLTVGWQDLICDWHVLLDQQSYSTRSSEFPLMSVICPKGALIDHA